APAPAPAAPRHDPSYLDRLAAAIERERDYPMHSRRQGHQGRVVVHVVIAASGRLVSAQVLTGSGLETLDRAALGMVQRARLPPLTPGLGAESATFTIPIVFAIR
ncbi:MAG: energy transducer TonB, partial [Reyranella sp.]|nr:energy transducer TonB [Reyranella sp.]